MSYYALIGRRRKVDFAAPAKLSAKAGRAPKRERSQTMQLEA